MGSILLYSDFKPGVSDFVDDALLNLLGGTSCRVGYIPSDSDTKRRYFDKICDRYRDIGIDHVEYFDLGVEYAPSRIPDFLKCDAIQLSGGDPVRFLSLVRERRFADYFKKYLADGGVLIGVSAGAMILCRSLDLIHFVESNGRLPKKNRNALGMLPFEFWPHFKNDESENLILAQYSAAQKTIVYACDDDAGILINGSNVTTLGQVFKFGS